MWYHGFDLTYIIFVLPALIIAMWAQANVKSTFNKYGSILNRRGIKGSQAARMILDRGGLSNVLTERVAGRLSDHYDPRTKIVRLSEDVFDSSSVSAIGVTAHEVGHALQHSEGYLPLKIRNGIIPLCNICSKAAIPLILIGAIASSLNIIYFGIILFAVAFLFQIITLPVEFNASRRALLILDETGMLTSDELLMAKKVLNAAALTYVAAMLVSLMQLLRFIYIFAGRGNRR